LILGTIHPEMASKLITLVNTVFTRALNVFGDDPLWKGQEGAYFCFASMKKGLPLVFTPVGDVAIEKAEKYVAFSMEKARRLAQHPEHVSSFQSRNPPEQWGGAIHVGGNIFSMSGLPELGDEAVMLVTAFMFFPKLEEVRVACNAIAQTSENPFFRPLVDSIKKSGL